LARPSLGGTVPLRNKVVIVDEGFGIVRFADWAEQLIAELTGKLGTASYLSFPTPTRPS
jgi:glucose-6-phosphate isomerase